MATNIVEYTLELNDQMSAKLKKIGALSDETATDLHKIGAVSDEASAKLHKIGAASGEARNALGQFNKQAEKVSDATGQAGRSMGAFATNMRSAISSLPFGDLLTNPIAQAGAAIFGAGKMSLTFSENLAKINTTAQMTRPELEALGSKLQSIGRNAGADLSGVPVAFEKILSQTGDADLSLSILEQTLKGAEAGFTETETVAGALANTLSLVGKENTNAKEVLDTLFAAKRVGAGEFKDFAQYVPGLVASGQALGKGFKETAGLFAYMTGKGIDASKSATLMENAFTALGKSDITQGMEKAGISVFNTDGSMKQIDVIMASMSAKLAAFGNDDQAKSNFLESIGLKDAQAKQAFMVMSSDAGKLSEALKATANAAGEADRAFANGESPMRKMRQLWSDMQYLIIGAGDVLMKVLYPALVGVTAVVGGAATAIGWLSDGMEAGNTAALLVAAGIGTVTIALGINYLLTKRAVIQAALLNTWNVVQATTMGILTGAIWAQNAAWMANPIGLIVAGVAALIAGIAIVVAKTDGWTATWNNAMSVIGDTVSIVADKFGIAFNKMRVAWYQFKEAMGLGNSDENKSAIAKLEQDTANRMDAIEGARKRRAETKVWQVKWNDGEEAPAKAGEAPAKTVGSKGLASSMGAAGAPTNSSASSSSSVSGSSSSGVSIKIGNLIGSITFNGTPGDNAKSMQMQVETAILQALNMAAARG